MPIIMKITTVPRDNLLKALRQAESNSLDFILLVSGAFGEAEYANASQLLEHAARALKNGGLLFIQGLPEILPHFGVLLDRYLTFKYWLAVESEPRPLHSALPSVHAGVLLFAKGKGRVNIRRVRLPHQYCKACGRTLKDWGGKAHLMHPEGYVISDVIKDLPKEDNYTRLSKPLYDLLLELLDFPQPKKKENIPLIEAPIREVQGMVAPTEGLAWEHRHLGEPPAGFRQLTLPGIRPPSSNTPASSSNKKPIERLYNVIHQGDAIEILRQYPDESIDLVFADPPYNLDKEYILYNDEQSEQQYIEWCNAWLAEYARILKPTGSLFVLNLPHWALYHADFLNQHLYFQNWIVWDALSEPRGKIMPAHYALLYYTKQKEGFTFNYESVSPLDARHYCLRASCIRKRKKQGDDDKTPLTDIWWDIHRIKHRRDRDYHPCQLPEALMQRIIELTTNPGDVVLDAFGGTGTTPLAALRLQRRYVAIDIDPYYVQLMQRKIQQFLQHGEIQRESIKRPPRQVTKKALQLELRRLARDLGRLPTPEDVKARSKYDLSLYLETFPTWGKALKAAKLERTES
ncbi:site-specific DNA-methyltransferase [Candidatus Parcubacteria bacterium]|nr:MAG: site-specific DNA-methyltransferase [Candidatus Parcubacteria bacterium]